MAEITRYSKLDVIDYSGATTTIVPDDGLEEHFDNVTGFDAGEIVTLVGNGSSTRAALLTALKNNTVPGDKTFTGTITATIIPPVGVFMVSFLP